jgi:predicted amidophosphoribosyltransferase
MKLTFTAIGGIVGVALAVTVFANMPLMFFASIIGGLIVGYHIDSDNEVERVKEKKREQAEFLAQEHKKSLELRKKLDAEEEQRKKDKENLENIRKNFGLDYEEILRAQELAHQNDAIIDRIIEFHESQNLRKKSEAHAERETPKEGIDTTIHKPAVQIKPILLNTDNLEKTLLSCVASWNSHGTSLKHKWRYDYYPFWEYKNNPTSYITNAWHEIWYFKNDPNKNVTVSNHRLALNHAISWVKDTLKSTFGEKTKHLTLVCLTASTQQKTDLRFKEFAGEVCRDLNMTNAYDEIKVTAAGTAKHLGGNGVQSKSYNRNFFKGKYIVLFDDVRTSGESLNHERLTLEGFGAKVICAITLGQTTH